MMIEIKIASALRGKIPHSDKNPGGDKWDVPEETGVADVLKMLDLADLPAILILNGHQTTKTTLLKEGDVLKIISAVSGG